MGVPEALTFSAAAGGAHPSASAVPVVIGLGTIVVLVLRKTRGQPIQRTRLMVLPAIVLILGVAAALPELHGAHLHTIDDVVVALDLLLSLGLGMVRGRSVQIYQNAGATWYRYGPVTVALWGISIALRFAIGIYGTHHGATSLTASASVLFMLGLSLLSQNVVIALRQTPSSISPDRVMSIPSPDYRGESVSD